MSDDHQRCACPIALQPDEGEALWFMGMLATIKASTERTGGRVAVIEHTAPYIRVRPCTSTTGKTSGSTCSRAN